MLSGMETRSAISLTDIIPFASANANRISSALLNVCVPFTCPSLSGFRKYVQTKKRLPAVRSVIR
ncbi:hypothetical protein J19TS2_52050 [Cohnella xylanilytica]|nr:hypothetical protein J19TS2_52050 [Cohnella xylanilytica]